MDRNRLPPAPKGTSPVAVVSIPLLILGGLLAIFILHNRFSQEEQARLDRIEIEKIDRLFKRERPEPAKVYVLLDAEKAAAEYPATFEIPMRAWRESCKLGDLVKVSLEVPPGAPKRKAVGERPWLIIKGIHPGPRYLGKLDNDLVVFPELDANELIEFGPEHILQLGEDQEKK